jgi:multiple sugar transport system substrate-binding protein
MACARTERTAKQGIDEFTFATWAAGKELSEFQQIIDRVNAAAEGRYMVKALSIPSDYYIKISTLIAARKAPHFFWLTQELIPRYAQLGAIADITENFNESEKLRPEDFYPGVISSAKYNDRYYGIPWIANPLIVYCNKNLFEEAGVPLPGDQWTWDDFIDKAKKLTMSRKDSLGNDYMQYGFIIDGWPNLETFIWGGGGDIIAENGVDILLDDEAALKGLDVLHTIIKSGISPEYSRVSSLGSNNVWFEKQRSAMFMGGIQDDFERKNEAAPEQERFEIWYAPVPTGLDGKSWAFNWTASTVLSAGQKDNPLAYEAMEQITIEFFKWKISPPIQNSLEQVAVMDPRKTPALPVIEMALQNARSAHYVPEWNEINNLLWVRLYSSMLNDSSFDYRETARSIAEQSRQFIAKRK